MGDGIMALFGASIAHEDRAVRACYAALRTRETVNLEVYARSRARLQPLALPVNAISHKPD
jgi:class 3 adenylate cyclase